MDDKLPHFEEMIVDLYEKSGIEGNLCASAWSLHIRGDGQTGLEWESAEMILIYADAWGLLNLWWAF